MGLKTSQYIALFAGALTMLVQGAIYVFGTITPYINSYLYYQENNIGDTNIEINDLQIIVTISVLCVNLGMVIPKYLPFTLTHQINALISIIGIAGSVFAVSFATSFSMYVLTYGIFFGIFIGYGYIAPLKNCMQHVPDKKGLCSGICIMGFGIGAFFFNIILLNLINPNNQKFDQNHRFTKQVAENVPIALRIISGVYLVIGLIASSLIRPVKSQKIDNPLEKNQEQEENEQKLKQSLLDNQSITSEDQMKNSVISTPGDNQSVKNTNLTLYQILFKKKIINCMAVIALTVPFGGFVAFYYKEYGMTKINNDQFLTILGSCASVINGISRLFWGTMIDKISFKAIATIMNMIFILGCSTIYFAVNSQITYLIVVLMAYCCYAGNYSIYPIQTVRILGQQLGGKCYWVTFTGFGIGAIMQFFLHYFLVMNFHQDGFLYCFIIFGLFLFTGTYIAWTSKFQYHPEELKYIRGMDLDGHNQITGQNIKEVEDKEEF